ncbi:MAG: hypothetical protein KC620_12925, partial [Myxococcales bacterium]|nr:hypothetical protein [Myxococcales bacterium]
MSDQAPLDTETERGPEGLMGALRRHRRLLFAAGLIWFAVMLIGGILLSQVEARSGLHVFGTGQWVAGEPAVVRVVLRELRFARYQPIRDVTVTLVDAEGQPGASQSIGEAAGPFVQGTVRAPRRPGVYQAELRAEGPDGPVSAHFPITVIGESPGFEWPKPPKQRPPMRPDIGPLSLDIGPADGVLPGGLPGVLTVRARDAEGRPVATAVTLQTTEGRSATPLPETVTTDRNGLAHVPVQPMHPTFTFELSAGESHAVRRFTHTNTQYAIEV